jgi:putative two-component system response regulator
MVNNKGLDSMAKDKSKNSKNVIKKKILLIDDDEVHLSTTELFLKDEYEILKAISGEDALKYLYNNEFTPDLIMLDIIMPYMDGWEVFNRIKAIGLLKNVPIVFLTSEDGEREKKRARELGAVDYITKPYTKTFLIETINEIIQIREDTYKKDIF